MPHRRSAGARRLDDQRTRIVAAAIAVVADRGFAGCAVATVAARAGVASGTVYNRFPNRAELAAEVFRTVAGAELTAFRQAAETDSSTADRIVAIIETFAVRILKAPRLAFSLIVEPADPRVAALRLQYTAAFRTVVEAVITAGVRSGELPPQDAVVSAAAVVGSMTESMVDALAGRDDPATIPMLIAFVLRGLGSPVPDQLDSGRLPVISPVMR
jgi:AcrR family transcriptional regulator